MVNSGTLAYTELYISAMDGARIKIGDLVYIKWKDSTGCPMGWQLLDEARSAKAAHVESVGWVMATSRKAIQLAPHVVVRGSGAVQGFMTIPRSAVLRTWVLERTKSI